MSRRDDHRTRLGKVVGSYKPPLDRWTYWPEKNWQTNEPGFVTFAPSGARRRWVRTEKEARRIVGEQNREDAEWLRAAGYEPRHRQR